MGLHCTLAGGMKTWPPVESWHTIRLNICPAAALASVDEVTSPVSVSFSVLPWPASNTGVAEKGTMDKPEDPPEPAGPCGPRSEEHTSELQSLRHLVCRLLLEK